MLAYAALPVALHFLAPEMLAARGLPASVGWGYINLRSLELVLSDLRIGPPEGPGVTFDEFRADILRDGLTEGRIELANLRLRGASLDIDFLSVAQLPDADTGVPFQQLELLDLRLEDLSEKLGRDVVVRHARLHRESQQGEKGLTLELEVDAGGGALEIRGTLHGDSKAQSLEGTLSANGLPARLFDPSPAGEPSTWSGSVYAVAEFEFRHDRPGSRTSLRAKGALHTTGLGVRFADLDAAEIDSAWKGTLTLSGPAFGVPERVYFQGTLDASTARVGSAGGDSSALVSGLHWEGIGGWHGVSVAAGKGSADSIEFHGRVAGAPPLHVELDHVQLQATLDDAGRYHLEHLRVRNLRAIPETTEAGILAHSLEARKLQVASDGLRVERVAAASLEALTGNGASARRWTAERLVLQELAITPDSRARAAGAALESLNVRGPALGVNVLGVRMEALRLDPQGRLEIGLASLEALVHRGDDAREFRIRDLRGESVTVGREGVLQAGKLDAARIAASLAESESWTAYDLVTKRFRFASGDAEAGEAALDTLVYRGKQGDRLEGAGFLALSLALRSDAGAAARFEAESLRFDAPHGTSWEAHALSLSDPHWRAGAKGSAARSVSADLRYKSPSGERWHFADLGLGNAAFDPEGAFRIENVDSGQASVILPSGEALEAVGLRSGTVERDAEGSVSLADVEVETLTSKALSGLAWRALPVEVESLVLLEDGHVDARRLRSGTLTLDDGEGGRWQANGVAARRFDWHWLERWLRIDPLELEQLEFASARGVDWHADALIAGALYWSPGRTPQLRNASAAVIEGKAAPGLAWKLEDLQAAGDESGDAGPSRFRVLSAGAGHLESASNDSRFSWSELRATDLQVAGAERLEAGRVVFEDVSLNGESPSDASVSAARLEIGDLVSERGRIAAETVTLDDSAATLGVDESGEWMLPSWPRATNKGGGLAVEIGVLANGGHNRVVLVDRSVDPPHQVQIEPYRLRVNDLDTLNSRTAARLEVGGTLDATARLEVRGELRAARRGFDTRAHLRLRDFDFSRLSEYARRHLDVLVRAGSGDVDFDIEISDGEISAEGDMVFRELSLEAVASEGSVTGAALVEAVRRLDEPGHGIALRVSLHGPIGDPGFELAAEAARAIARSAGLDPGPNDPGSTSQPDQE